MRTTGLENSLRAIRFRTLARVRDSRIEGGEVIGRWWLLNPDAPPQDRLQWIRQSQAGKLAEEFANCRTDEAGILRFTKKFGPLRAEPEPNEEFRFSLVEWRRDQARFRRTWEHNQTFGVGGFDYPALPGEGLGYFDENLYYTAVNIWRLMWFDLLSCPRKRLRKCKRPDCPNPYFVARHLGQTYCSDLCAQWGQRQWKLDWWNRVGKKRRSAKAGRKRSRASKRRSQGRRSHRVQGASVEGECQSERQATKIREQDVSWKLQH